MATAEMTPLSQLTPEAKRSLVGALLLDLTATEGDILSVEAGGRLFTVFVPPTDAAESARQAMLACTPEEREDMRRMMEDRDPKHLLSGEELIQMITEDAARSSPLL